ncbi:hypothetical protein CsSME_00036133 [Camellia sinensis var. sinensis]
MLPYKYRVLPGCGYAYRSFHISFRNTPRLKNFEGARVPCLFDHLLPEILPREFEEHFEGAIERFNQRLDPLTIIIKKIKIKYRRTATVPVSYFFRVLPYRHTRTRTRTRTCTRAS